MRQIVLAAAIVAHTIPAMAGVPNMICKGIGSVVGSADGLKVVQATDGSDVFRVVAGHLYHRWSGRDEYRYNKIEEVGFRRYASGHMLFVFGLDDKLRGYVVIAATDDWRIVYLNCAL